MVAATQLTGLITKFAGVEESGKLRGRRRRYRSVVLVTELERTHPDICS